MKTIAIPIDEETLALLDRLARSSEKASSRSRIVRQALEEFLRRRATFLQEARERTIYAKHQRLVARQAGALVGEQAKP
jgi:metal-responsive CopG/Arc/MetJ family transcriptional regulator